ncbi:MAG: toll/interleukin-1 receptor domain-containing protein [Rikenellaceae bacterium]
MKYDVFISYSSKDQKVVEALSHYLESCNIRCFVAYRDIPKGIVWAAAITAAIESSQMMLVVFSENFNNSDQVDREIEMCSEEKKPILTYRIADANFKGAKKYYLKNINWIDAFPNPEINFGELQSSIKKLICINKPIEKVNIKKEPIINLPADNIYVAPKSNKRKPNIKKPESKKISTVLWTYIVFPILMILVFPFIGSMLIAEPLSDKIRNRLCLIFVMFIAQFIGNSLLVGIPLVNWAKLTQENIIIILLLLTIFNVAMCVSIMKDDLFKSKR